MPLSSRPGLRMAIWLQVKARGCEFSLLLLLCPLCDKASLQLQLRLVALYNCYNAFASVTEREINPNAGKGKLSQHLTHQNITRRFSERFGAH